MALTRAVEERWRSAAEAEVEALYNATGIDLSASPAVMKAAELSAAIGVTEAALAQDRYRNRGIPFIKMGRRVRYVRADVARYLAANRHAFPGAL